ncbi:MAG: tRNA (adenosine(37)-N6)-threonylcarbamoyltransferase complex dimerization subunit type 1 TsaB [Parvularculaceae bacterium]
MKILAIDTSFEACSAAIVCDDRTLWSQMRVIGKGHAEALAPMVADGLAATGLEISDFDRIGVVVGPGAFAGVRVGLAFARALCLGTPARAVGVTSTQALAASLDIKAAIAPVFDARRGQVYAALYGPSLRTLIDPFVASPGEAATRLQSAAPEDLVLTGSGAPLVLGDMKDRAAVSERRHIDPAAVARLAGATAPASAPPTPLYLRPPDATPSASSLFEGAAGR